MNYLIKKNVIIIIEIFYRRSSSEKNKEIELN